MKNEKYIYIFISIVGFLALSIVMALLFVMQKNSLNNLETGTFAVALAIFSTAVGMIFTIWMASKSLNEQLKMHGKLAMRRLVQSIKSCKALVLTLNHKYEITKDKGFLSKDVSNEFLENIIGQASRLTSSIFDSREDWRDILKEERKEADEFDKEFAELILKSQTIGEDLLKTKTLLRKATEDRPTLEVTLKSLEQENKKIREELMEKQKKIDYLNSIWPTTTTLSSTALAAGTTGYSGDYGTVWAWGGGGGYDVCANCGILALTYMRCSKCGKSICLNCAPGAACAALGSPLLCKDCKDKK